MGHSRLQLLVLEGQIFAPLFFENRCLRLLLLGLDQLLLGLGDPLLDRKHFKVLPLKEGRRLSGQLLGVVFLSAKSIHVPSWNTSRVPKHRPLRSLPGGHGFSKGRKHSLADRVVLVLKVVDGLLSCCLIRERHDFRKDGLVGVLQGVIGRAACTGIIIFPIVFFKLFPALSSLLGAPGGVVH